MTASILTATPMAKTKWYKMNCNAIPSSTKMQLKRPAEYTIHKLRHVVACKSTVDDYMLFECSDRVTQEM